MSAPAETPKAVCIVVAEVGVEEERGRRSRVSPKGLCRRLIERYLKRRGLTSSRIQLAHGWEDALLVKIIVMIGAILMSCASNVTAQESLAVGHCVADLRSLCPGIPPGNNNLRACMREHIRDVSFPCLVTLAKFAEVRGSLKECSAHLHQQCASVERGGGQFGACLKSAVASLSDTCKDALARAVRRVRDQ
jgi:hypothetical protein